MGLVGPRLSGGPRVEVIPQVVPAQLTTAIPWTFHVLEIEFVNNTGFPATVEVTDGLGQSWIPPTVIPDKAVLHDSAVHGRTMVSGLRWSSSQDGVIGHIIGVK